MEAHQLEETAAAPDAALAPEERLEDSLFPVVGVGASAGGLEAFTQLLGNLPDDTGMAFVLVQHLAPRHESQLADLLSRTTRLPVNEATEGMAVRPNHVYVIPPDTNMVLAQGNLRLTPRGETRGLHLPVDTFFRSLAQDQPAQAIGVVLSGTGSDGTLGIAEIKAAGGLTFAQEEASAPYAGMPHSAIASGGVDSILPPAEIARELARLGRHPYLGPPTAEGGPLQAVDEELFRKILARLQAAFGVDFTHYRDTTIRRRIMRRLALHATDTLADYARRLEEDRSEMEALYHDLLINVTRFFRDPELFETLKRTVFPEIQKSKLPGAPIRVWVAGCSTGQEAYSLAIALLELLEEQPVRPPIQIFATDLSEAVSLAHARAGLYSESIEAEVSPERLRRFFTKEEGGYRIHKSIRDMCVFARHNVAADPPFSRVDLISCRNVLIYMAPPLQQRVIPTFHYALNATGLLVLGASETVGRFTDLFDVVDSEHKIYARRATVARQYPHFATEASPAGGPPRARTARPHPPTPAEFQREADRVALGQYVPPGVLVNDNLDILQFRGRTSPYLEPAPGEASLNLLKMAREGLFFELRGAINEARTQCAPVRRPGVPVRDDQQVRKVELVVIPVKLPGVSEGCFLILFEEPGPPQRVPQAGSAPGPPQSRSWPGRWVQLNFAPPSAATVGPGGEAATAAPPDDHEVGQLRQELAAAREYLQSIIEQQDVANEELTSANEEILSSNEELQSTNEELETAKEELQSVNEELTTVNDQLEHRNVELTQLSNDLTNLLGSANIPIVMLGPDLRIRRFTTAAGKLLNLLPGDLGRPIGDHRPTVDVPELEQMVLNVIDTLQPQEREVRDRNGRWHALHIHPYRTTDNKIDGAVVAWLDIDAVKIAQELLRGARDYARAIVETVREPLVILGADLRVNTANQSFYETFQVSPQETEGQLIYDLGNKQWDLPELRTLLEEVLPQSTSFEEFAVEHDFPGIGARSMRLNARQLRREDNQPPLILLAIEDVTERQRAEKLVQQQAEALREADRRKDQFLAMLAHELRNPLGPIRNAAQLLQRLGSEEPHVRRAREIIERQVSHQARLLDDLLDVSRITQGKTLLQFEPLDLAHLVRNTAEDHRSVLEAAGLTLSLVLPEEPVCVLGDATRLAQAVGNLLQNTAKFTDRGGRVTVRLDRPVASLPARCPQPPSLPGNGEHGHADPAASPFPGGERGRHRREVGILGRSWVTLTVSDTGMGIEPEMLPHVFEMFAQADRSLDRSRSGLGLGLALVKGLVELHGGEVRAESEGLGHGTEFSLLLPGLAPPPRAVESSTLRVESSDPGVRDDLSTLTPQPSTREGPLRVLIVEDNPDAAETLREVLELSGCTVAVALSGPEAVEAAPRFRPEVVLCDLGLPGLDGYQVAAALRQNPATANARLIAISGYGQAEDLQRSREAGFDRHLTKPVDLSELERLLGITAEGP
jgi:two-component system CheB/CheR fusion protein